jgi:hypothetical protein
MKSEHDANLSLQPMVQRHEPRAIEHYRKPDKTGLWAVLVVLGGAGAGLLLGLAAGLIERFL